MLFNAVYSSFILTINFFAFAVGATTLTVYFKQRKYVQKKAYRRERGLVAVHMTLILESFLFVHFILSLSVGPRENLMSKEACLVVLAFETYCLLAVFAWSLNNSLLSKSISKLRMTPSLKIRDFFLIGYLSPLPFVVTLVLVAAIKDGILACDLISLVSPVADNKTAITTITQDYCRLDQCSLLNNIPGQLLAFFTFIIPIAVVNFYGLLRLTKLCLLLWHTWNQLKVKMNVKERVTKFKSRFGIQRSILVLNVKVMFMFAAVGVIFIKSDYKELVKKISSVCVAALVIIIFINNCIICEKETNPLTWLEDWWKSKFNPRIGKGINFQSHTTLSTIHELGRLSTPQLTRIEKPLPNLSDHLKESVH